MRASKNSGKFILMLLPTLKIWHQMLIPANPSKKAASGSERVFSLAAAVPNGLLSLRQESGGNAAKAD